MVLRGASSVRNGMEEKDRRAAKSPEGLFTYPTGEASSIALSNGVLDLMPDKPAALREVFRVLKLGGRLQACDMSLAGDEPPPDKSPWFD
jgi:hypothetical protein